MTTLQTRPAPRRSLYSTVGATAVTKIAVMGMSGVLGVVTSRLIISSYGVDAYAQYGLLGTLPALMPFADLGISAAVLNVIAGSADPRSDLAVRRVLTSALRIMLCSGAVIAAAAVLVGLLGWWPAVLGDGLQPGGGAVATWCVVLFGLALPLSIGPRTLVGLGRNPVQIATQALVSPFMIGSVGLVVLLGLPAGNYLAIFSYLASALVSTTCLVIGARLVRPQVGAALRDVPRLHEVPGVRVMDVAWPMLVQMLALPVAMQTDRLLLSHVAGSGELAQYNLASQLFGMVLQTIAAAGVSLWPVFARARTAAEVRSPFGAMVWFVVGSLAVAGVLVALMPLVVHVVSDGAIEVGTALALSFVAFVVVQAAKYPLGMYMTDVAGLRFQVGPILAMVPLNLGISWALIAPLGAAGPVAGSAVAVLLCQVLPSAYYVRRDLARRRDEQRGSVA
jgi:O-antigen/teichoic acid export membrane protein